MASTSLGGTGFLIGNQDDIVASADRLRASLALSRGLSPTFGGIDSRLHSFHQPGVLESPMTPAGVSRVDTDTLAASATPTTSGLPLTSAVHGKKIAHPNSTEPVFDDDE
jgi:hypothetical protein